MVITAHKSNILVNSDQFAIIVLLHDYFRQVFNDCYQQKHTYCRKIYASLVFATSETSGKTFNHSVNKHCFELKLIVKSNQNTQENVVKHSFIKFSIFHAICRSDFL